MFSHLLIIVLLGGICLPHAISFKERSEPVQLLRLRPNQRAHWIKAGHNITLLCEGSIDGPYTNFRWIDPQGLDVLRPKTAPAYTRFASNGLSLHFVAPTPVESGQYVCEALEPGKSSVEISVSIDFVERVSSEDCPPVQYLVAGHDAVGTIRCGGPDDEIVSIQNQTGHNHNLELDRFSLNRNEIHIHPVSINDAGTFLLYVIRRHVVDNYLVELKVRDPPISVGPLHRTPMDDSQSHTSFVISLVILVLVIGTILIDAIRLYYCQKGVLHELRQIDIFNREANDKKSGTRWFRTRAYSESRETPALCYNV